MKAAMPSPCWPFAIHLPELQARQTKLLQDCITNTGFITPSKTGKIWPVSLPSSLFGYGFVLWLFVSAQRKWTTSFCRGPFISCNIVVLQTSTYVLPTVTLLQLRPIPAPLSTLEKVVVLIGYKEFYTARFSHVTWESKSHDIKPIALTC